MGTNHLRRYCVLTLALLLTLVGGTSLRAQQAMVVPGGPTLPLTCQVRTIFFKTGASVGVYQCLVANVWTQIPTTAGTGDVVGPASSVDGQLALYNGTTGKLIKAAGFTGLTLSTSGVASAYAGTSCTAGQFLSALNASGSGTCGTPSGSGNVTAGGTLTSGQLVIGQGSTAVAVGNLSGDVTTSGSTATTLANSGVSAGSYTNADITVDAKGRVTAASNGSGGGGATIAQGAFAALPATCTAGNLYLFTDTVYNFARCSATDTWSYFLNGREVTLPGVLSGWTGVNTGADWTATDANGTIAVQLDTTGSLNWRLLAKAAPSTPYTVTAYWRVIQRSIDASDTGLYFYDGTKLMGLEFLSAAGQPYTIRVEKINSVTSDNSTVAAMPALGGTQFGGAFVRLANDGTTLSFAISIDGMTFYTLYSESVGTFITPTHYGWGGVNINITDLPMLMSLQHLAVN